MRHTPYSAIRFLDFRGTAPSGLSLRILSCLIVLVADSPWCHLLFKFVATCNGANEDADPTSFDTIVWSTR